MDVDQYPLPCPEDLFATPAGGKYFTHLDLAIAFQQLILDEDFRQFVTINTHRDLYRYRRLPFGVTSVFQRTMDTILQGLEGVVDYIDDMLVTGKTYEEHLTMCNLDKVLERLRQFSQSIGYQIDAALKRKLLAITNG